MTQVSTRTSVKSLLDSESVKNRLHEILGKNAATFATSVIQITQSNDLLANADPHSVVGAAMVSATLNLPLNNALGFAYIVPFNEKQKDNTYVNKAQFQIGAKGFKQLAIRSGQYVTINDSDVREGEIEFHDRLTGEITFRSIQDDEKREKQKIIGYVSYFELMNGFKSYFYMTVAEIERHAKKYSQTYKAGFGNWVKEKEKMSLKTVTKLHLNSGKAPLSIEMQAAIDADQAVISVDDKSGELTHSVSYADNEEVKKDPDAERMRLLIDSAQTEDDFDFARSVITDPVLLAELDLKEVELKKGKK